MSFQRTTVITSNDQDSAKATLQTFLNKDNALVMVILGHTQSIERSMSKADNLAKLSHFNVERWVIWVQAPEVLEAEIKQHLNATDADKSEEPFENIKCFCFSHINNTIDGIILKKGRLSTITLLKSFMLAQNRDTLPEENHT